MAEHHHAVGSDGRVHFQGVDAEAERPGEAGQGVFGHETARAAVSLEFETVHRGGGEQQQANEDNDRSPVFIVHRVGSGRLDSPHGENKPGETTNQVVAERVTYGQSDKVDEESQRVDLGKYRRGEEGVHPPHHRGEDSGTMAQP